MKVVSHVSGTGEVFLFLNDKSGEYFWASMISNGSDGRIHFTEQEIVSVINKNIPIEFDEGEYWIEDDNGAYDIISFTDTYIWVCDINHEEFSIPR